MPTIAAGASLTIHLAAGDTIDLDGIGTAQITTRMPPNVDTSARRFSVGNTLGPYPIAGSLAVTADPLSPVTYDIDAAIGSEPVAQVASYKPPGQTIVALGDSLSANAATVVGNVAFYHLGQASAVTWMCALSKQAIWLPYGATNTASTPDLINYMVAVSGVTTEHLLSVQVPQAIALNASWWSIQAGTNDFTELPADTALQTCGRLRAACEAGVDAGAIVILSTIPPRNDAQWQALSAQIIAAGSTVALQRAKQMAVNAWIRRYAMETPGVVLADPYDELVDLSSATGDWRSGMSDDGTHWSNAGAFTAGLVMLRAVTPYIKAVGAGGIGAIDVYSTTNQAGNLTPDAGFQGTATVPTATGMSGDVPTNWNVNMQDGTATAVCSVGARTDSLSTGVLANGRELQIAVSTAGASSRLRAYGSVMSNLVPANTPFYCEMEVSVSANSAAWDGPALQCFFSSPGSVVPQFGGIGIGPLPVGATFDAVIRTPISSSTVAAGQLLFAQMLLRASSAATMKIRRIGTYTVLPTMPGLVLGSS